MMALWLARVPRAQRDARAREALQRARRHAEPPRQPLGPVGGDIDEQALIAELTEIGRRGAISPALAACAVCSCLLSAAVRKNSHRPADCVPAEPKACCICAQRRISAVACWIFISVMKIPRR